MSTVNGQCDERFDAVRAAFERLLDEQIDIGASAAVTLDGDMVVDLWGGHLDAERTTTWDEDTIINVYSSTKTMSFLAALLLVDRGEIDVDAPVARYWPGFETNGKEGVLVRHILGHTAGLSGWQEPMTPSDLYDWDKATDLLARQAPWWDPGSASGYHALTQGYLIGEVVRRVTGRSIGRFFADEIASPLGADFHIGLAAEDDHRVARVIPPPPLPIDPDPDSLNARTFTNPRLEASQSWDEAWRRAEIPAGGGHGNARSMAIAQTPIACGGTVGDVELLSPETCERIFEIQAAGRDLVLGIGVTFGLGYGLSSPKAPIGPNPRTCYWGGWGGSLVVMDLDARLCVAYAMNRMGEGTVGDDRAHSLLRAAYESLRP